MGSHCASCSTWPQACGSPMLPRTPRPCDSACSRKRWVPGGGRHGLQAGAGRGVGVVMLEPSGFEHGIERKTKAKRETEIDRHRKKKIYIYIHYIYIYIYTHTLTHTHTHTHTAGGRFEKEGEYVCLRLIFIVVWQKPMQHCKAVILQLKIN